MVSALSERADERDWWQDMSKSERDPAGIQISVRGICFAYLCTRCQGRAHISSLFQQEPISQAQATSQHAYCYRCSRGLDGSEENYHAYRVSPSPDGHYRPSAFSLLEMGLVCDEFTRPPTVARVQRHLLEDSMVWSAYEVQAALHVLFPDAIAPVFLEANGAAS